MSMKRNVIRSTAIALTGVTVIIPVASTVSAVEISSDKNNYNIEIMNDYGISNNERYLLELERETFNDNTPLVDMYSDDQSDLMKVEFKEKFSDENIFKKVYSAEGVRTEINGHTGDIKVTEFDDGGGVTNVLEINYFQGIEAMKDIAEEDILYDKERAISVLSTLKTGGPDKLSLKVDKSSSTSSKVNIYATSPSGSKKTYTKPTSSWSNGYTGGFKDNINVSKKSWSKLINTVSPSLKKETTNLVASLVMQGLFNISRKALEAILSPISKASNFATIVTCTLMYLGNLEVARMNYNRL